MPRKLRHQEADAYYHVVARGNNKQTIFDDELRHVFLSTLRSVATSYDWRVVAFALMRNHYHLVMQIGDRGLSDGMCVLNTRFARASNLRYDRINHCLGQRFWSSHLDTPHYLLNSIRYAMWNPPRANRCADPGDTTWTSYRGSVGLDDPHPVLAIEELLTLFHTQPARARQVLAEYVHEGRDRCQAPWDGPSSS